ncbi:MAG TPA: hybrid sensor histidine kinase/response regulator [Cyanobacteria bacterium UBA8803]|nr:hybrid sensor histidine kinase/response regulator [Cyanobacteria bacterium UBA8803]
MQFSSLAETPLNATAIGILAATSTQSFAIVPMRHSGQVVGLLVASVVHYSKTWSQEEINLLQLVGELIAMGCTRHQAEEALIAAKDAAEAANRAKSAFLANMSHELRTPLNAILGFAQLLERDTTLTSKQRESVATINRSGEHLLNLIDDVLEMSKIEAGRIVLNPDSFDLHLLLRTLQEMFLVRTKAKQLFLKFELAPDLPQYIRTDEGKLRQVLINLLGNAVKFTQTGGVTLRVGMRTGNEASSTPYTLHFEVEDTGYGIAPDEIDNLFQPFVQTSSGAQIKEGTGLGLTISRQFVRLMGGNIGCSSILGQGSRFTFNVQVHLVNPLEVATSISSGRVLQLAPHQPSYRILVVDDRQENCDLIVQLLGSVGFEVQSASNGQEAIALWETWQPHLIWMDMRMPVMDGYEAARQIRAREPERRGTTPTKIIALTASAFEEQKTTILAAGCDDLVRKPFREQIIFDKITEHLGVQYIFENQLEQLNLSSSQNLDCLSLNVMNPEWIAALRQAAIEVDGEKILQLCEQIPQSHRHLADKLIELVHHFGFDEILALTD